MPATITINGSLHVGASAAATIKSRIGRTTTKIPAQVTLVREGLLRIGDDDFRAIIACTAMNGVTNFLVSGSHLSAAEQQRRCVLARANELLKQLMATIRSLEGAGADLEFVIVPLQELFDWVARERERETVPLPPPNPGPINVARY